MKTDISSVQLPADRADTVGEVRICNQISGAYGLRLSEGQMQILAENRIHSLKDAGRVEFGPGVLKDIVAAFCDSPYIYQENYEETLAGLQDIFYYFKSESMEGISDSDLIDSMARIFNGEAGGSLGYLADTGLPELCGGIRSGACR